MKKRISLTLAMLAGVLIGQLSTGTVVTDQEIYFLSAVKKGDLAAVEKMLASDPKLLMARGDYGLYPLQRAIVNGHKDVVELLIAKGADVNRCNNWASDRETSLHWAALYGEKEIAEFLIAKGADVNAGNLYKETPLLWAIDAEHLDVAELLLAKGADVNARNTNGFTALHWALWADHKSADKAARLLIAKGADIRAKDSLGRTPLHWAALQGQKEIAGLLIEKGAEVNDQDTYGNTPLYYAAYAGFKDIAELLVSRGADRNIRNKEGRSQAGIEQLATRSRKLFEVKQPQDLINYLVPLPKEVKIKGLMQAPVEKVCITTEGNIPALGKYAIETLSEFFARQCGSKVPPDSFSFFGFKVKLIICDKNGLTAGGKKIPGAERLAQLPNPDQSYLIRSGWWRSVSIVALTGQGLYNGVNTLKQLLAPGVKKAGDKAVISFPVLEVLDWPDLPERGMWSHGYHEKEMLWLSERKCNVFQSSDPLTSVMDISIAGDGKGHMKLNREAIEFACQHGINFIPGLPHQDLLHRYGDWVFPGVRDIYQRYPDLMAKGGYDSTKEGKAGRVGPCASNPMYVNLLTDWISDMASYQHVTDIQFTLSEKTHQPCRCSECQKLGQHAAEAKAAAEAWRRVREKYPDKRLWIVTHNPEPTRRVIAVIPHDMNINLCHYEYDLTFDPLILPEFKGFIDAGGRVSACHKIGSVTTLDFHRPAFVRNRMKEFIEKRLWQSLAYTEWHDIPAYDFSIEAAAEWSWNLNGRSSKEFAFSYAVRKGLPEPEKFALWVTKLEPVTEKIRPWDYLKYHPWDPFDGIISGLKTCDVLILPQVFSPESVLKQEDVDLLRAWVKNGGNLLLTHDAVGYRSHPVMFPELCKGKDRQEEKSFSLLPDTLPFKKDMTASVFNHAYYDRIVLEMGKDGNKAAVGPKGEVVTVYGSFGKGRIVATGLIIGIGSDDKEVEPENGELELLLASLKFLTGKK